MNKQLMIRPILSRNKYKNIKTDIRKGGDGNDGNNNDKKNNGDAKQSNVNETSLDNMERNTSIIQHVTTN